MAASFAAALLDELMGRNRDVHPSEKRKTHWSDDEVCKPFLCGFCPNYLFTNTRADLGRCDKIHDEDFRESYKKSPRFEKMGYEREFTEFLKSLISEVDKRIRRGEQRLVLNSQPTPTPTTPQMVARKQRIDHLTSRIGELVEEAETLGCDGNVDQAQCVMVLCEKMRDERTTLEALNETERVQLEQANEPAKAMEVCTTCGALLVLNDAHQRMDEHVIGKQHMGYAQIRAYIIGRQQTTSTLPQELVSSCLEPGESLDDLEIVTMSAKKTISTDDYRSNVSDRLADDCFVISNDDQRQSGERRRDRNADDRRHGNAVSSSTSSSRHRSRSKDRSRSSRRSSVSPERKHHHSRYSDSSSSRRQSDTNNTWNDQRLYRN